MDIYPQTMINAPIESRIDIGQSDEIQAAIASAENQLAQSGRILLRPSGTEPLIRVMVEGRDEAQVANLAAQLAQTVADVARA